jgi:hypothetical protein
MRFFDSTHVFQWKWADVTTSFWRKYPNWLATHVKRVDCYGREMTPDGKLVVHRLITSQQALPSWLSALGIDSTAHSLETTVVDPVAKTMVVKSKNLSGSSLMTVDEVCTYAQHPTRPDQTNYTQTATFTAHLFLFGGKLEDYSLSTMAAKSQKGLKALESICDSFSPTETLGNYLSRISN